MFGNDSIVSLYTGDEPALLYDDQTGEYVCSPFKSSVKFSWQPARLNNVFAPALTANQKADFSVRVTPEDGGKGDVEVAALMLNSTGRCAVQPYVPGLDKFLSNVPVSSALMFGTAQLPALLPQTIYGFPSVDWTLTIQDLTGSANTVSAVLFGRRFCDRNQQRLEDPRQAMLLQKFMHPYWLGPSTAFLSTGAGVPGGPEVTLAAGATITLEFTVNGDVAFNCFSILDDSSSTTGVEPVLTAQIFPGENAAPLNDVPMSWRDFLASPTVAVTGFPGTGNIVRAASLPSPAGCWTNLFERSTKVRVVFTSGDAGTITLRCAFAGVLIYASEPLPAQVAQQAGNIQGSF